ncbi:c-type cytochrome biogenesis protein CcsB [Actinotalea sp. Marseille-Q4924]|uniref:c-type cytochrome biogenesis protein CcsB n=1 Tax=Actinotalea sp. Marseille-Q4924 TaxID=2866571 RepID=UPI001CE45F66|nr:c-type cytochrome biogenesis protein CcsB [Actinotalea sp. Marseille-Q4924]
MTLGELSHIIVWGATAAYAVALLAFSFDLAGLADRVVATRREGAAGVARTGARGTVPAAGSSRGAVGTVTAAPTVTDARGSGRAAPPVGGAAPRRAASIGMAVTVVGLLLHVVGTVTRGLAAGRVPWANMYEFTLVGTLVAVGTFVVLCRTRDLRFLGAIVLGLTTIALGVSLVGFYVPAAGVEPALQSPWLVIHVSIATIATGLFTVAFAASALQLLKDSREARLAADVAPAGGLGGPSWRWLDVLPSLRDLEALSFRINAVGFVLWTFTIIAGAIWAEAAWGRYWGWDPKEVWSFVVWVVYAAYLHARTTRGWSGRRAAWFVLVGYVTVIFNFTVVNLLFQGLHSYSGL